MPILFDLTVYKQFTWGLATKIVSLHITVGGFLYQLFNISPLLDIMNQVSVIVTVLE